MNLLHIDSSPAGDQSFSRKYSAALAKGLLAKNPGAHVTYHDLASHPFSHVDPVMLGAMFTPADQHNDAQKKAIAASDKATAEVLAADIIIIGAPMYNFSIPSVLKAWIDNIVRNGKTFAYGEKGPHGLIPPGKKVYLVVSRGGVYSEGPAKAVEHQDSYLKAILGFVGLTDVEVLIAEGTALGPDSVAKLTADAEAKLTALIA
jgi:FMN-dependent NADH-azoreductase